MDLTSYLLGKNASSGGGGGGSFNATIGDIDSSIDADYGVKQFITDANYVKVTTTYGTKLFQDCTKLQNVGTIDCNNSCVGLFRFFYGCNKLETVTEITNTSSLTDVNSICYNCSKLTTFPSFDSSHLTDMTNMFANCTLLSDETLNNILDICIHATSFAGTKKLSTLGITNSTLRNKVPSLSNYQAFLDAGWTIA